MSTTNCINCGVAKDTEELKCPFCGTTYLDLTAIDFSSGEPIVCQFVLPYTRDRTVMRMLAIPRMDEIRYEPITCSFESDRFSRDLHSVVQSYDVNVAVSFIPVMRPKDKALVTFRKEPKK